ncbi:MAG: HTH domain-containing protein, partial [Clostridiales bacterium]
MSVKEQVLTVFENNKGQYISGEDLAGRLSVSRSAVWKGVKALQAEGYQISAISNKGYCLSDKTDILSVQSIEKYLKHSCLPLTIEVYKSLASTNTFLKNLASQGASEGRVIIAEQQTQGKGRMNRQFISPTGSGIYMSLLLRPKISA